MTNTAKNVAIGFIKTGKLLTNNENRMDICKKCDYFSGDKCKKCGCKINLKTLLLFANCPMNKW